jgi:hypothetical protein
MRANVGNGRVRTWRKLAGLVTAGMLGSMIVGPVGVSANDTRSLYVGDPTQVNTAPTPYEVHPTPVSVGQITYFDVLIKNLGKQTLTSAVIGMGTLIADNSGLPGPQLPTDWTIKNVTSQSGKVPTCVTDPVSAAPDTGLITPGAYNGFSCSFGNLAKGSPGGTIRVFLTAGATLSASNAIAVSGKVAEAVGGNVGSNQNTFYAYGAGSFFVTGDGKIAGLFTNQKITPAKHVTGKTNTTVDLTTLAGDYVVSIDEVSAGPACPVALPACSNDTPASTISVNQGQAVSPYFVWTVQFPVPSTYKLTKDTGFIHFFDGYNPTTSPNAYEVFYNVNQTSCLKPHAKPPCADFTLFTDPATALPVLQVVFETTVNGAGKYQ